MAFLALSILPRQDNGGPIYGVGLPGVGHVYGGANNIPLRGGKLSDWEVIFVPSLVFSVPFFVLTVNNPVAR